MSTSIQVTKLEAAQRQLNKAIRMLFNKDDQICTHTLAGAASILLTDLVEHQKPGSTWDKVAQEDNKLNPSEYFQIARKAQNFLKHAKDDPNGTLTFNQSDTIALLTIAVFNASELAPLSPEAEVFQLWSLALLCPPEMASNSPFLEAIACFGNLSSMELKEQLSVGQKRLFEYIAL